METEKTQTIRDDQALTSVAEAYYHGLGMPRNYEQAFRYYKKAASMGNALALGRLGVCYELGQGCEKDMVQAMTCYEDAADQQDISAMWHLGDLYWNGVPGLLQKDVRIAADHYFDALITAEQMQNGWDAADIFLRVGDCLFHGVGTDRNIKAAYDLYGNAADGYYERITAGDLDSEELLERAENSEEACRKILGVSSRRSRL